MYKRYKVKKLGEKLGEKHWGLWDDRKKEFIKTRGTGLNACFVNRNQAQKEVNRFNNNLIMLWQ